MNAGDALVETIDAFATYLAVERALSPRTVAAYRDDLTRFSASLDRARVGAWRDVTAADARAFAAAGHRNGQAAKTTARRLSAIRSLFAWLIARGVATVNPARGIRAPKIRRTLPKVVDADAIGAMLDDAGEGRLATRDQAMVELFYSSALRLSELANLTWRDLDLDSAEARIVGKGMKTRIVPIGAIAIAALLRWRDERAPSADGAVFASPRGGALTPRAIQKRVERWSSARGNGAPMHPHRLRHSAASHLLESSGNLRAVQELLGHSRLATTEIYTHLDFQHLAKVYDAAHPRARGRNRAR